MILFKIIRSVKINNLFTFLNLSGQSFRSWLVAGAPGSFFARKIVLNHRRRKDLRGSEKSMQKPERKRCCRPLLSGSDSYF